MTPSTSVLYLLGIAGTAVFLLLAGWATFTHRRAARRYSVFIQRMPQAVEYEEVGSLVRQRKAELDQLIHEAAGAAEIVTRKQESEQWLREHEAQLTKMLQEREEHTRIKEQLQEMQKQIEEQRTLFNKYRLNVEFLEQKIKQGEAQEQEIAKRIAECKNRENDALAGLQLLDDKTAAAQRSLEQLRRQHESEAAEHAQVRQRIETEHEELRRRLDEQLSRQKTELESLAAAYEQARGRAESEYVQLQAQLEQQTARKKAEFAEALLSLATQQDLAQQKLAEVTKLATEESFRLEAVRAEVARLTADADFQQSRAKDLREDIAGLKEEYSHLSRSTGRSTQNDDQRTAELWQPVFSVSATKPRHEDEAGQLHKVEGYLQSQGLQFHPRTIRAFHTSLKSADISPLVVLAGISGTGKSELPRRYAEAMGMHYLCLPVQPRWDSPQDMFGFFNYLENRYRSTELARALVQMDPFYDADDRGWNRPDNWARNSLRDQMLLVLLDEMNLARVEYYFSEFLSRLETRRGINKNDATDRSKAEVVLETGASGQGSPTMRLFVDTNVLFVGTMNEDESTQTLSDKVVDRSNVLRFGRPRNLTQDTTFHSNGSAELHKRRLAFSDWQEWLNQDDALPSDESDKVNRWIASLNDALAKIHRPFAHRTHQAIRSYVTNYPKVDEENRLSHAFADQIEQKILPKFRGIDIEDSTSRAALDEVKAIVRELGDQELEQAIAGSVHDHQFVWTGVDRLATPEGVR